MPDDKKPGAGPLSGEVTIPGTKTKVPKVLVLVAGVGVVVVVYLATKGGGGGASEDLGGGISQPNGETVGGASGGASDSTAITDALAQQSQTLSDLLGAIQNMPQVTMPAAYPVEVPMSAYPDSGYYAGDAVDSWALPSDPGLAMEAPQAAMGNVAKAADKWGVKTPGPSVNTIRPKAADAVGLKTPSLSTTPKASPTASAIHAGQTDKPGAKAPAKSAAKPAAQPAAKAQAATGTKTVAKPAATPAKAQAATGTKTVAKPAAKPAAKPTPKPKGPIHAR